MNSRLVSCVLALLAFVTGGCGAGDGGGNTGGGTGMGGLSGTGGSPSAGPGAGGSSGAGGPPDAGGAVGSPGAGGAVGTGGATGTGGTTSAGGSGGTGARDASAASPDASASDAAPTGGSITVMAELAAGPVSAGPPGALTALAPLAGHTLYCVTLSTPPVAGTGTSDAGGKVSLTFPAQGIASVAPSTTTKARSSAIAKTLSFPGSRLIPPHFSLEPEA